MPTDREAQARELASTIFVRYVDVTGMAALDDLSALILAYGDRCRAEASLETEAALQGHDDFAWGERGGIATLTCGLCGGYFVLWPGTPDEALDRALNNVKHPILDNTASLVVPCPKCDEPATTPEEPTS